MSTAGRISEPGRQYAVYLHHSIREKPSAYIVNPGSYSEEIEIPAPAGTYQANWIDPATGDKVHAEHIRHGGGALALRTPVHSVDIALGLRRIEESCVAPVQQRAGLEPRGPGSAPRSPRWCCSQRH